MARHSLIVLLVAGLVASPVFAGKLYKWVDPYGNVTYQDRPPPSGSGWVEEKSVRDRVGGATDTATAEAAAKNPVTLYMVSKCSSCDLARAYLKKRNVPFSEVDVSSNNPKAQQEMQQKIGELAVPTITVGSKVMKGYLESLLEGELDAAGYPKAEQPPAEGAAPEAAPAQ